MELENEINKQNYIENNLEKNIELEEASINNQKSFLETTLGKVVNTRIRCRFKNDFTRFNRRSSYTNKSCYDVSRI